MSNTIRAALERLVRAYDNNEGLPIAEWIATARAALAAEPVGEGPILQWTDNNPPCEECRFDHCTAETPFGRFLISWKSWKQFDSPTVDETPWGDWYGAFNSVDAAKAACQKELDDRLARWGRPAAPAAPEAQRDAVIAAVTEALGDAYDCQRVWDAWRVGTMGQDDFALVAEDSDRVAEIADAAIEAMRPNTPPAAAPAPEVGEVGELADRLGWIAAQLGDIGWSDDSASVTRAAALLQQPPAPAPVVVPVAVGEVLPSGTWWAFSPGNETDCPAWVALELEHARAAASAPFPITHLLPHHAIPLSQAGEGEV